MKFIIPQPEFSKILLTSGKSLSAKTNLPILSNILIDAQKNMLVVLSTNLETAIKVTAPCKVETTGAITLEGKTFLEFVSQLPQGDILFEKLGEEVVISAKNYKARFATMPPDEFPAIPKIEKGFSVKIDAGDFTRSVSRVAFSASLDEGRPSLTGVLFEINKGLASMVATDGYRLGFSEMQILKPGNLPSIKIIIPAKALLEFTKIIEEMGFLGEEANKKDNGLLMLVSENMNQVNFKIGDVEFTSRLIEGEFPNWRKTIPQTFTTVAKIPKDEFKNLIRIASIFARDLGNVVKLKFEVNDKGGTLNVFTSADRVDTKTKVDIKGKGGEIAFNFRYLQEVLSAVEGEEVTFEMIESLNPGKITGQKGDPSFHIIMPVRLQS